MGQIDDIIDNLSVRLRGAHPEVAQGLYDDHESLCWLRAVVERGFPLCDVPREHRNRLARLLLTLEVTEVRKTEPTCTKTI